MAETAVVVQQVSEVPADISHAAVDDVNGNSIANPTGDIFISVRNTLGNSSTVTIVAQTTSVEDTTYGTLTKSNIVISMAANEEKMVGPFKKSSYNDANGNIILSFSGANPEDLEIAALKA